MYKNENNKTKFRHHIIFFDDYVRYNELQLLWESHLIYFLEHNSLS